MDPGPDVPGCILSCPAELAFGSAGRPVVCAAAAAVFGPLTCGLPLAHCTTVRKRVLGDWRWNVRNFGGVKT